MAYSLLALDLAGNSWPQAGGMGQLPRYGVGTLNDTQFAAQTMAQGGASRNVHTGQTPRMGQPNAGYAVAVPGHEVDVPAPLTPYDTEIHRKQMLADPQVAGDPSSLQGSWVNNGKVTLDRSQHILHFADAYRVAKEGNQKSVFDLSKTNDVDMPGHWQFGDSEWAHNGQIIGKSAEARAPMFRGEKRLH